MMTPKAVEKIAAALTGGSGSAVTGAIETAVPIIRESNMTGSGHSKKIRIPPLDDIQVLNEEGKIVNGDLDPKLPEAELLRIHRALVLTRQFDARMLTMQRQGQMGTFAPSLGQEAVQIGQVYPLSKDDWYSPSYRSFGAQIWRGWPMDQLLLLWAGFFAGFAPPADVNDLPFSIVIGAHVPTATGVAMGMKYRKEPHCMLVNFGDGASSQGIVAESFNFAATFKAPCVFVLENNGWAISTPVRKQTSVESLALQGVGYGLPSMRVDGNDVLGMIAATTRACDRARSGGGPSLIEAVTYRMSLHTTADDPKVYRDKAEVEAWEGRCPILRFERYLQNRGLLDDAAAKRILDECTDEVLAAREVFRKKAIPKAREIFSHLYTEMPAELVAQQEAYFAKLDRMGVEE